MARGIKAYVTTKRFGDPPYYSNGLAGSLAEHTAQESPFVKATRKFLEVIYREGYGYKKAGVMLYDIRPRRPHQESLFGSRLTGRRRKEDEDLMAAVDQANREHGKGTVSLAAGGLPGSLSKEKDWTMKRQNKSPRYATRWDELPVATAR